MATIAEITTNTDADQVMVDGVAYALADLQAMTLAQAAALRRHAKALERAQADDLSEEQVLECERALDEIVAAVVPQMPQQVRARLGFMHRMRLVDAFFGRARPASAEAGLSTTTTSDSSPASSASTAAPSATG